MGKLSLSMGKTTRNTMGKMPVTMGNTTGFVGSYILHHMAANDLAVWEQPRRGQLSFHHALHVLLVHTWLELHAILPNP